MILTIDEIEKVITEKRSISIENLYSKSHKSEIVYTRQLIMTFAYDFKLGTLYSIGARYGKDHATVIHATKVVKNYFDTNRVKRREIIKYISLLNSNLYGVNLKSFRDNISETLGKYYHDGDERFEQCTNDLYNLFVNSF